MAYGAPVCKRAVSTGAGNAGPPSIWGPLAHGGPVCHHQGMTAPDRFIHFLPDNTILPAGYDWIGEPKVYPGDNHPSRRVKEDERGSTIEFSLLPGIALNIHTTLKRAFDELGPEHLEDGPFERVKGESKEDDDSSFARTVRTSYSSTMLLSLGLLGVLAGLSECQRARTEKRRANRKSAHRAPPREPQPFTQWEAIPPNSPHRHANIEERAGETTHICPDIHYFVRERRGFYKVEAHEGVSREGMPPFDFVVPSLTEAKARALALHVQHAWDKKLMEPGPSGTTILQHYNARLPIRIFVTRGNPDGDGDGDHRVSFALTDEEGEPLQSWCETLTDAKINAAELYNEKFFDAD